MAWLQVRLTTDAEHLPLIEAALTNAGALAVTLDDAGDDPQLEPAPDAQPLWARLRVTGLFADEPATRERVAAIAGVLGDEATIERIEDRPWERAWLADFRPTRFGARLWVCPRGQAPEDPRAVVVELDPGLAFGTGHHATTALCLEWLDGAELTGRRLIDYGCGSGILAIAALRLGASRAVAVDHDPQALEATRANAAANGVADRLLVCAPDALAGEPAELLVANILAAPLIELAPRFARLVRPGGPLALSGLLAGQVPAVSAAYRADFALDPPHLRDDWVLLSGRRLATGG
ncbi:MAG: 50S ribosomal protein L11 methyltransferase [Chromatiaceae bacterium]|jgi:ribosomal protein L11 methyltransferase|nr:50S ribosomal protein L11 methyltransferase [Chromatiaceae bacterium]